MRDGLTVVTNFSYTRNQLRSLNNISYLYNPNWNPLGDARAGRNTMPMALLFVTKEQEIGQSNISSQEMIMYKGEGSALDFGNTSTYTPAQINTIADNIVNQPKQYQLEALLPTTYDSLIGNPFNTGGYRDPAFMTNFAQNIVDKNGASLLDGREDFTGRNPLDAAIDENGDASFSFSQIASVMANVVPNATLDLMQLIISLLSLSVQPPFATNASLKDWLTTVMNGSSYNKDSFEAMWYGRSILKYKPPMEWNYKTVAITHYNCSKNPTEDGCYRISLTLQELPMLSVNYINDTIDKANSAYVKVLGDSLKKTLDVACTDIGN